MQPGPHPTSSPPSSSAGGSGDWSLQLTSYLPPPTDPHAAPHALRLHLQLPDDGHQQPQQQPLRRESEQRMERNARAEEREQSSRDSHSFLPAPVASSSSSLAADSNVATASVPTHSNTKTEENKQEHRWNSLPVHTLPAPYPLSSPSPLSSISSLGSSPYSPQPQGTNGWPPPTHSHSAAATASSFDPPASSSSSAALGAELASALSQLEQSEAEFEASFRRRQLSQATSASGPLPLPMDDPLHGLHATTALADQQLTDQMTNESLSVRRYALHPLTSEPITTQTILEAAASPARKFRGSREQTTGERIGMETRAELTALASAEAAATIPAALPASLSSPLFDRSRHREDERSLARSFGGVPLPSFVRHSSPSPPRVSGSTLLSSPHLLRAFRPSFLRHSEPTHMDLSSASPAAPAAASSVGMASSSSMATTNTRLFGSGLSASPSEEVANLFRRSRSRRGNGQERSAPSLSPSPPALSEPSSSAVVTALPSFPRFVAGGGISSFPPAPSASALHALPPTALMGQHSCAAPPPAFPPAVAPSSVSDSVSLALGQAHISSAQELERKYEQLRSAYEYQLQQAQVALLEARARQQEELALLRKHQENLARAASSNSSACLQQELSSAATPYIESSAISSAAAVPPADPARSATPPSPQLDGVPPHPSSSALPSAAHTRTYSSSSSLQLEYNSQGGDRLTTQHVVEEPVRRGQDVEPSQLAPAPEDKPAQQGPKEELSTTPSVLSDLCCLLRAQMCELRQLAQQPPSNLLTRFVQAQLASFESRMESRDFLQATDGSQARLLQEVQQLANLLQTDREGQKGGNSAAHPSQPPSAVSSTLHSRASSFPTPLPLSHPVHLPSSSHPSAVSSVHTSSYLSLQSSCRSSLGGEEEPQPYLCEPYPSPRRDVADNEAQQNKQPRQFEQQQQKKIQASLQTLKQAKSGRLSTSGKPAQKQIAPAKRDSVRMPPPRSMPPSHTSSQLPSARTLRSSFSSRHSTQPPSRSSSPPPASSRPSSARPSRQPSVHSRQGSQHSQVSLSRPECAGHERDEKEQQEEVGKEQVKEMQQEEHTENRPELQQANSTQELPLKQPANPSKQPAPSKPTRPSTSSSSSSLALSARELRALVKSEVLGTPSELCSKYSYLPPPSIPVSLTRTQMLRQAKLHEEQEKKKRGQRVQTKLSAHAAPTARLVRRQVEEMLQEEMRKRMHAWEEHKQDGAEEQEQDNYTPKEAPVQATPSQAQEDQPHSLTHHASLQREVERLLNPPRILQPTFSPPKNNRAASLRPYSTHAAPTSSPPFADSPPLPPSTAAVPVLSFLPPTAAAAPLPFHPAPVFSPDHEQLDSFAPPSSSDSSGPSSPTSSGRHSHGRSRRHSQATADSSPSPLPVSCRSPQLIDLAADDSYSYVSSGASTLASSTR